MPQISRRVLFPLVYCWPYCSVWPLWMSDLELTSLLIDSCPIWRELKWSHSVVSNSLWHHGLEPTRLLGPWDFPGMNAGVSCHSLLQGNLPDPGIEPRSSYIVSRCFTVWATREAPYLRYITNLNVMWILWTTLTAESVLNIISSSV